MGINFTPLESAALYELLAEHTPDIFLKTDCKGFVQHASPAIGQLGLVLPDLLIGPHIADLAHPDHAGPLRTAHDAAIRDRTESGWLEIPAVAPVHRQQWFEIRIRPLANSCQQVYGAISVMRSIDERRCLEEKLFTAAMTDPLTGLTNRRAFIAMLQHLIDQRIDGCLAVFDIDHFRAINMQYGQFAGDDVLVIFAELVRDMMRQQDIISRIGGESLGVMLPGAGLIEAEAICQRIVDALSRFGQPAPGSLALTVSAGIARIGGTLDETIKRAEMALFLAKAKGRNRLELDGGSRHFDLCDSRATAPRPPARRSRPAISPPPPPNRSARPASPGSRPGR